MTLQAEHDVETTTTGHRPEPSVARAVAVSTVTQVAAKGLHIVLNVVVSVALVRHLGPDRYGDYVLVVTVAGLLGLLSEFGLPKMAVRAVAREADVEAEVVGSTVVVRLLLSIAAAAATQAVLWTIGASGEVHAAGAVASALYVTDALLSVVIAFHVRLEQQYEAVIRLVMETCEVIVTFVLIARGASLAALLSAPVYGGVLGAAIAFAMVTKRYGVRPRWSSARARVLVVEALPVGPATFIGATYLRVDAFILAAMRPAHEVGIYGAAWQPVEYLLLTTAILVNVLFPLLSRWHMTDRDRFRRLYASGTEALVAVTLPIAVVTLFLATPACAAAFGGKFAASAAPLRGLTFALVLMTVNAWQGFVLVSGGHQHVPLRYQAPALVANIVLDLVLIPQFGAMGPVWATLITSTFTVACSTHACRSRLDAAVDVGGLARVIAANGLLAAAISALATANVPWWLCGALALVVYPACLLALGVGRAANLRAVLSRDDVAPTVNLVEVGA